MKNEYSIEGVKCGGCVAAVKEKLSKLDNVDNVEVNIQDKNIVVEGTASKEELQAALLNTNYKIV
ncbi:heavy-metal-associated domain-containing protein [uncultured Gemella sp.]|uniref:heavy-metal-associated domain-containing protein n=1 Tax=uncultured Gemella sp. TaxID=254352 RepID=UPI0025E2C359|nr:cation transporter [uncultured Gemella sp.]